MSKKYVVDEKYVGKVVSRFIDMWFKIKPFIPSKINTDLIKIIDLIPDNTKRLFEIYCRIVYVYLYPNKIEYIISEDYGKCVSKTYIQSYVFDIDILKELYNSAIKIYNKYNKCFSVPVDHITIQPIYFSDMQSLAIINHVEPIVFNYKGIDFYCGSFIHKCAHIDVGDMKLEILRDESLFNYFNTGEDACNDYYNYILDILDFSYGFIRYYLENYMDIVYRSIFAIF